MKINRRGWTVDLLGLKRDIAEGTLKAEDRDFIEKVLPRFCDFAAGNIDSWPMKAGSIADNTDAAYRKANKIAEQLGLHC